MAKPTITTQSLKEFFKDHYSYVYIDLSTSMLQDFIDRFPDLSVQRVADYLYDHILSQGLADDVVE